MNTERITRWVWICLLILLTACTSFPFLNIDLSFGSIYLTSLGYEGYRGIYRFNSLARSIDNFERITPEDIHAGSYDWSLKGEWLIYICEKPGEWVGICRNDKKGKKLEVLLTDLEFGDLWWNYNPLAVSPDGKKLSFSSILYEFDPPKYSFYIYDFDLGVIEKSHLFNTDFVILSWSPDGKTVILRTEPKDLYLLDIAKMDMEFLSQGESGEWSPDGKQLVLVRDSYDIYLLDIETKDMEFLTNGMFPTWSPDGSKISYLWEGRFYTISILDGQEDIVLDQKFICPTWDQHIWSPDGKFIVFISVCGESDPENGLYIVNSETGKVYELYPKDRSTWDPQWIP